MSSIQSMLEILMKYFTHMLFLLFLLPTISYAQGKTNDKEQANVSAVEKLSPALRGLLSEEMLAIQSGMMSIIPAYAAGNWATIGEVASKIEKSYILDQKLTKKQIKELETRLPPEFIKQDERFHYLAGMLAHAAESEKPELINFYFSEMNAACAACHADFATHRFSALKPSKKAKHSH